MMKKMLLPLALLLLTAGCAHRQTHRLQTDSLTTTVSMHTTVLHTDSLLRLRHMAFDSLCVVVERDSMGERITLRARRATMADTTYRQTCFAARATDSTHHAVSHTDRRTDVTTPRRPAPLRWLLPVLVLMLLILLMTLRSLKTLKTLK